MPKYIFFNLKEGLRNIKLLPRQSLFYLIFLVINHLLVVSFFICCVNLSYLNQLIAVDIFPGSLNILLAPITDKVDKLSLVLFFVIFIFLALLVYTNRRFIKKYLKFNKNEVRLVKKLQGDLALVRRPIIYICFFINLTSLILVFNLSKFLYRYIFQLAIQYQDNFNLLQFDYFDRSLFIFLFIITTTVLFCTIYYLFWELEKQ